MLAQQRSLYFEDDEHNEPPVPALQFDVDSRDTLLIRILGEGNGANTGGSNLTRTTQHITTPARVCVGILFTTCTIISISSLAMFLPPAVTITFALIGFALTCTFWLTMIHVATLGKVLKNPETVIHMSLLCIAFGLCLDVVQFDERAASFCFIFLTASLSFVQDAYVVETHKWGMFRAIPNILLLIVLGLLQFDRLHSRRDTRFIFFIDTMGAYRVDISIYQASRDLTFATSLLAVSCMHRSFFYGGHNRREFDSISDPIEVRMRRIRDGDVVPMPPALKKDDEHKLDPITAIPFVHHIFELYESDACFYHWFGPKWGAAITDFYGMHSMRVLSFVTMTTCWAFWVFGELTGKVGDKSYSYIVFLTVFTTWSRSFGFRSKTMLLKIILRQAFLVEFLCVLLICVILGLQLNVTLGVTGGYSLILAWFERRTTDARCIYFHTNTHATGASGYDKKSWFHIMLTVVHILAVLTFTCTLVAFMALFVIDGFGGGANLNGNNNLLFMICLTPEATAWTVKTQILNVTNFDIGKLYVLSYDPPTSALARFSALQIMSDFLLLLVFFTCVQVPAEQFRAKSARIMCRQLSNPVFPRFISWDDEVPITVTILNSNKSRVDVEDRLMSMAKEKNGTHS